MKKDHATANGDGKSDMSSESSSAAGPQGEGAARVDTNEGFDRS